MFMYSYRLHDWREIHMWGRFKTWPFSWVNTLTSGPLPGATVEQRNLFALEKTFNFHIHSEPMSQSFLCMCKSVLHVHVLMIQNNTAIHPLSCFWVSVPPLPYHHISVYSVFALTHIPLPVPYTEWEVGFEEGERHRGGREDDEWRCKTKKTQNRPAQFRLSYI